MIAETIILDDSQAAKIAETIMLVGRQSSLKVPTTAIKPDFPRGEDCMPLVRTFEVSCEHLTPSNVGVSPLQPANVPHFVNDEMSINFLEPAGCLATEGTYKKSNMSPL
jgi:hypothetical protein